MTSSRTRLAVLSSVFLIGLSAVLVHLWFLMVQGHDVWARRSYENRWAFRSVPSQRGVLRDRDGVRLAWDEPTTRVSVYYRRFRIYHVIGAAVHGATQWASLLPNRAGTTYNYGSGILGARVAAQDLLAVPVRVLYSGSLSKSESSPLFTYATTVLAGCSGLARKSVYAAMRQAAQSGANVGIGDVLSMTRNELLASFDERLRSLQELDALLAEEQHKHNLHLGRTTVDPTLLGTLEILRRYSLEEAKDDGSEQDASKKKVSRKEDIRRYFAHDVNFELAAALRVDQVTHPGIYVEPAIRREKLGGRDTALGVMLGEVRSNDRLVDPDVDPDETWVKKRMRTDMPIDWLDEMVPEDLVASEVARQQMRKEAERRYERELLVNERRGISGMEGLCNKELIGTLGMRFVEHDSRRREHRLWSHLRVESGQDVRLTLDLELQDAAEMAVRASDEDYRSLHETDFHADLQEAAIAIIDAHTGDVLAVAGAPITGDTTRRVPGFGWKSNGSIGSVVKPIVLLEHLESQRWGRACQAPDQIHACGGYLDYPGVRLMCDGTHHEQGRSPVYALAESCNVFFYQVGMGLGKDGVVRALQRFGLSEPAPNSAFFPCWQSYVGGLPLARPRVDGKLFLPRRAIGYGVEAAPLSVARAYAGIATGVLPQLGLRLGEERKHVALGDLSESLEVVREGMRQCVTIGTGDKLALLQSLQVHGKTGTAETSRITKHNNSWFAGYLPWTGRGGMQLVFCAVVYHVPNGIHGAKAAGGLVERFMGYLQRSPDLVDRYLTPMEGR